MMELRAEDPAAHRIIWHDLERERDAIERAIPNVAGVGRAGRGRAGARSSSRSATARFRSWRPSR
jgi:hypothetical protein